MCKVRLSSARLRLYQQALDEANRSRNSAVPGEKRIEVMLHSITDAVIATDANGRVLFMNPVAEDLVACSIQSGQE